MILFGWIYLFYRGLVKAGSQMGPSLVLKDPAPSQNLPSRGRVLSRFEFDKDALSVLTHGADGSTVVAVAAAPVRAARAEVEEVRVAREALVERGRPVVAPAARVAQLAIPAVASGGQENRATVRSSELATVHTVESRPFGGAIEESLTLGKGRHTPRSTPVRTGCIVGSTGDVRADVVDIIKITTIPIRLPVIHALGRRLSPGIVVTILLRCARPHIAARPQRTDAEVYHVRVVVIGAEVVTFDLCLR